MSRHMWFPLWPAAVAGFLLAGPALAQEVHHHPGKSSTVDRFYSTWMKPDRPNESCCSRTDCDEAEVKNINGQWWAKRARDNRWVLVPAEKIERHRDSPDGRNHFCASNYDLTPYCLVIGSGS